MRESPPRPAPGSAASSGAPDIPALTVAVWQCPQVSACDMSGVAHNLERLARTARLAAARGTDLLVVPELFLSGYFRPARVLHALALSAQEMADRLGAIARSSGLSIACGYAERLGSVPAGVANSAMWVDEAGRAVLNTRKTHLFGAEPRVFTAGVAHERSVAHWRGWCMGLLICYDVEFGANVRALARLGADAVLVPTANMVGYDFVAQHLVPTRAYENQVYLAYANCCGSEWLHPGGTQRLDYGGLSVLAAPDGQAPRHAGRQEALLMTHWRLERLRDSRAALPFLDQDDG